MHRVVAVGFDHMHIGDQLRVAASHPAVVLVGALDADPARMGSVCASVGLEGMPQVSTADSERVGEALEAWRPDVAIVCSTTAAHVEWVDLLARRGMHVMLEKPFAPSVADADTMIAVSSECKTALAINWPLAWFRSHRTAHRLVTEGAIGEVTEVHFYDGNRGPLFHLHDKLEVHPTETDKAGSWWYTKGAGGGSLLDYLGYGTTLGTWFRQGALPISVTATTWGAPSLEVDEQSVVVASYPTGLSTFQTRWGLFTDPWNHLTQPRTGFVLAGTHGTISSFDYDDFVTLQDASHLDGWVVPADQLAPERSSGLAALLHHLDTGSPLDDPISADIGRAGQLIVDAAALSASSRCQVDLTEGGLRVA